MAVIEPCCVGSPRQRTGNSPRSDRRDKSVEPFRLRLSAMRSLVVVAELSQIWFDPSREWYDELSLVECARNWADARVRDVACHRRTSSMNLTSY